MSRRLHPSRDGNRKPQHPSSTQPLHTQHAAAPRQPVICCKREETVDYLKKGFVVIVVALLCSFAVLNLEYPSVARNTAELSKNRGNHAVQSPASSKPLKKKTSKLGSRSVVARDEFFRKSPPKNVLDAYFSFVPPNWETDRDRLRLQPTWQCFHDDSSSTPKLVVLQMFRSASSVLRNYFRAYAKVCHRSLALVSQCIDLGVEFLSKPTDIWRNGKTTSRAAMDCWLISATNRTGHDVESKPDGYKDRVTWAFMQAMDILTGHLPLLGSDAHWWGNDTQYILMLRHPLPKFVSQVLFVNQAPDDMPLHRAVALVNRTLHNRLSSSSSRKQYYESTVNYLIKPSQRDWVYREAVEWTHEQRTKLAMANLFGHKVLVGLVDRIPETVQMLAHVLDTAHEVPELVEHFSNSSQSNINNRTDSVIAAMDADLLARLREFLKYDMRVYDYARQLHEHQYKWMQEDTRAEEQDKE